MNAQQGAQFVAQVLQNHAGAQAFLADVGSFMAFRDEAASQKPVTMQRIDDMMWSGLSVLPAHPFYRENFERLHAIMGLAALKRIAAAGVEANDNATDDELMAAWVGGWWLADLLLACSWIINGPAATVQIAPQVWQFALDGGFQGYIEGLHARRAPKSGGKADLEKPKFARNDPRIAPEDRY